MQAEMQPSAPSIREVIVRSEGGALERMLLLRKSIDSRLVDVIENSALQIDRCVFQYIGKTPNADGSARIRVNYEATGLILSR